MSKKYLLKSLIILVILSNITAADEEGLNFFMIGDYGWVADMSPAELTFNAMNEIVKNANSSRDQIDFFFTMGDNLYARNATYPSDEDIQTMMNIFNKSHIDEIPILAVRGNHDCDAKDRYYQVNMNEKYPKWNMPNLYYDQLFDIGQGKYFGVLFVDSCLVLCSNYSYKDDQEIPASQKILQSPEMIKLRDEQCGDPNVVSMGNEQFSWMKKKMIEWKQDDRVIWKATVQHHPIWGKWYQDTAHIVNDYLPLLLDNGFDFYLNGHEHTLDYANYPYSQLGTIYQEMELYQPKVGHNILEQYQCLDQIELLYGKTNRTKFYKKGEALHQFTTGATGFDLYKLCPTLPSMGRCHYSQNKYHGFSQVHVDPYEFTVKIMGVNETTKEILNLYTVTVINDNSIAQDSLFTN